MWKYDMWIETILLRFTNQETTKKEPSESSGSER